MRRLWLDANVFLRFLRGEPADVAASAARTIQRADDGDVVLVLTPLMLAEILWVMKSAYGRPIAETAGILLAFVGGNGVEVEERDVVIESLRLVQEKNVDIADAWLAVKAARAGETVCTFDKTDFKKLPAAWESPT